MSGRIVCQFSCGAASAVATKLAIAQFGATHDLHIVNAYLLEEHEDNRRFASDSEQWFGRPITTLREEKHGASVIQVFGYTAEETGRLEDFRDRNPDRPVLAPLIDAGLSKADCKAMVQRAGIELPLMYRLGYDNANCIGCVKGGEGYWRAIREDFPDQFEANCLVQDEIGQGSWFLRYRSGPRKGERFPLRDLPAGPARRNEELPSCSFFCEDAEREYAA